MRSGASPSPSLEERGSGQCFACHGVQAAQLLGTGVDVGPHRAGSELVLRSGLHRSPVRPPAKTPLLWGTSAPPPGAGKAAPCPKAAVTLSCRPLPGICRLLSAPVTPLQRTTSPRRPQKGLSLKTNNSATVTHLPWALHLHADEPPLGLRQVLLLLKNDKSILFLLSPSVGACACLRGNVSFTCSAGVRLSCCSLGALSLL